MITENVPINKRANFIPSFSKGGVGVVCKILSQLLSLLPPLGRAGVGFRGGL